METQDRTMRKLADAAEAASVFTATGRVLVDPNESSSARVPLLAAVSPKRDSGPCVSTSTTRERRDTATVRVALRSRQRRMRLMCIVVCLG